MMTERVKHWGGQATRWGILGTLTIFLAFPFVWMLITAFKRTSDLYNLKHNPFLFYEPPTLEHIHRLFSETQYGEWLLNTVFVGVLVVLITLALAVPAGYALARLTGKWGGKFGISIFLTYLVPPTLLFIPLSPLLVNLHLDDSLSSCADASPGRCSLAAGFGLSFVARPLLRLPDDGFLQSRSQGCGRSRHGRRL